MLFRQLHRRVFSIFLLISLLAYSSLQLVRSNSTRKAAVTAVYRGDDLSPIDAIPSSNEEQSQIEDVALREDGNVSTQDYDQLMADDGPRTDDDKASYALPKRDYREVFSVSTRDRKFLPIFLGGLPGYNANIIPHPTKSDFWIVVVQREQAGRLEVSEQLVCTAGLLNGVLVCSDTPRVVPIATTDGDGCKGDLSWATLAWGPRDARLFYGPDMPYMIYGSQSKYICFGLWLQDARMMLDAFKIHRYMPQQLFETAVELRRPSDYRAIEKNYFLFWDAEGRVYAHYNLWPTRAFAQLNFDGSGLSDLALVSAHNDQVCMAKFMPSVVKNVETIHQATNSLSITLCKRSDPTCIPNDSNTFIMHVFHHKSYYGFHGVYEPYVILFQRSAPFALHAVSQRPIWIHGRGDLTAASDATQYRLKLDAIPEGHSEMFYITSMSWKAHGQKYHGYIDDVLFLAFGIEDARPGVIDILAGDLLQDLAWC